VRDLAYAHARTRDDAQATPREHVQHGTMHRRCSRWRARNLRTAEPMSASPLNGALACTRR